MPQPDSRIIQGVKVVTAQEMARLEQGQMGHEQFMEEAGRRVAEAAMEFIAKEGLPKKVTLLVGRGNNGGDAYAAGIYLLDEGFQVHAVVIPGDCSPLNRKFGEKFRKKQGKIASHLEGVILDGLLGTGFKGQLEEPVARAIQQANASQLPILAIDIPSGLNGTTGEVPTVAIMAQETIALGLPKMGFFLREGWNHVGTLRIVDFGLPKETVAEAEAIAYLPLHFYLPKLVRNRHKYQAGYVIGYGGSKALSGAAKLTSLAALKAGAGIVRLFSPEPIGEAPLELICNNWNPKVWKEALAKAQSVFVGPGLGRSKKTLAWLKSHLKEIQQHCVIDADALLPNLTFPKHAILTPHRGEVLRLLDLKAAPREEELFAKIIRFCDHTKTIVVLKGAPTFVFSPASKPIVIPRGDPGMATAGTGDVLTGIIAALLAQGVSAKESAVLGVTLHAIAGEEAAQANTSYCVTASDLISFMPVAFRALMRGRGIA
jgi:NAD(P)H-hydrate epimerase